MSFLRELTLEGGKYLEIKASAIPISLYNEIMHDIAPAELEDIDVTIKLANRDTICNGNC